jgi:serine/threonine protein kinase
VTDLIDQQFGGYRLLRLIGKGGQASVYLGQHLRLQQKYGAIKILHASVSEQDIKTFQQEANTIAALQHPHIVNVLDFDIQQGTPFLVMEYYPDGSLRERHPRGERLPLPTVVSYVKQVAEALQHAHDHGLIHRDVKAANMLIGRRGEIVLSDFGIVAIAHSTSSLGTQDFAGTAPYMAPEQILQHPRRESDQYALAVVVYEWLCGELPFLGTPHEIALKHLTVEPPSLCKIRSDLSPLLEQVVFKALEKDPKQRFPSVQDFSAALQQASQGKLDISTPPASSSAERRTAPKSPVAPLISKTEQTAAMHPPASSRPVSSRSTATPSGQRFLPPVKKYQRGILLSLAGSILLVLVLLLSPSLFPLFFNGSFSSPFFQTTAVVGHGGDSSSHPSYFIALNLKSQAVVVEFKGGDPAKPVIYVAPLTTSLNNQDSVSAAFSDVTGDGRPDMLIALNQDFRYVFVNGGLVFRPSTASDAINQKNFPTGLPPRSNFPITQSSAVVGHGGDNASHPSYFLALNLQRQAIIIEILASDPSKARIYVAPGYLGGEGGDQVAVTVEFRDVTGDGKPDMIIHIHLPNKDQLSVFVNEGTSFRPAIGNDKIHF